MAQSNPESSRRVGAILPARETIEGAGVHLRRAFGHAEVPRLDPFLLLDDFRSENPAEYLAGFPWHPHRGIETVTYMLDGRVNHEDSLGNKGIIGPGDVQWMTAGSGIIHQEMPKALDGRMGGFQLWVNLPGKQKMMAPRYREVQRAQIHERELAKGVHAKVIAGEVGGVRGPVRDIVVDPLYLDVRLEPGAVFEQPVAKGHRAFSYFLDGSASLEPDGERIDEKNLVLLHDGERVRFQAGPRGLRALLVAGKPLGEPVAWWGPIVMTNRRELETAVTEFHEGTFLKHPPSNAPAGAKTSRAATPPSASRTQQGSATTRNAQRSAEKGGPAPTP
jgi:hypothetical protein